MEQGQYNKNLLMPIPMPILQEIVGDWRNNGDEDYLLKFTDLLACCSYQFDDIWFFKLTSNCLVMELDHNSYESRYMCPVLKACCRLLKSSFFKSHPRYSEELYQKINVIHHPERRMLKDMPLLTVTFKDNELYVQYFEKVFCSEDIVAVELFLEVYCCLRECPDFDFVDKKYETSLKVVVRKLISVDDGLIAIPVKRVMLQLIIFFIEESGTYDNKLLIDLKKFVYAYPKGLRSCGDYEFQFSYTEAVLRLSHHFPKQDIGYMLASADSVLFKSFMSIDEKEVDKTCRNFLNVFNSLEPNNPNKVYSFPCIALSFGKIPLKKPNSCNFWVDINQGSSCISFCCDVSTGCEFEQLVPLFLPSTDIHRVTCTTLDASVALRVELSKACVEYPISNYDHFKAMDGRTTSFIFEKHVELFCLTESLNSLGLKYERASQELPCESEFVGETPAMIKASAVNFPIKPFVSNDENEDLPSTSTFEGNETQAIDCRSSDDKNGNLNSQKVISAAKASIAESLVLFDSSGTIPYPGSNSCEENLRSDIPDKPEKANCRMIPDNMDRTTRKSCIDFTQHMKNYPKEKNRDINKASLAVDVVACHGISNSQNQVLHSVQNSSDNDTYISETLLQPVQSPVMNNMSVSIPGGISPSSIELKKKKRKTKSAIAFESGKKLLVESSSSEEFAATKCKRKCKFTAKRNRRYALKTVKNKSITSSYNDSTDSEPGTWEYKSNRPNGFDCNFKLLQDGSSMMHEKSLIDAATQCTPTVTVIDQNKSPSAVPWFCNKTTMCSPVLSGPSSTLKPSNTFRRRLIFDETSPKQTCTNDENGSEFKGPGFEQMQCFMDNCNALHDFGKKISTKISQHLASMSMKQISSIKSILNEFQTLWKDQLKTSMEMNEEVVSHLNTFMTKFQNDLKLRCNLQNQQEQSASLVLDGLDTFLSDINAMGNEVLTSTKNAENDLISDMSFAKSELLNSILSSVQQYLHKTKALRNKTIPL